VGECGIWPTFLAHETQVGGRGIKLWRTLIRIGRIKITAAPPKNDIVRLGTNDERVKYRKSSDECRDHFACGEG
jgi:hypothetical protein